MSACGFEDGGPGCVIYDEKRVSCGVTVMPGCEGGTWICRRVEGMCEVGMCVCVCVCVCVVVEGGGPWYCGLVVEVP